MASLAKQLMDEFHAAAQLHKEVGLYMEGAVFDSCENVVNNSLHGRSFAEVASRTRATLVRNAQSTLLNAEQAATYAEAVVLFDEFVARVSVD